MNHAGARPGFQQSLAIVEFARCYSHRFGGPNDEVIQGHPLYGQGLEPPCRPLLGTRGGYQAKFSTASSDRATVRGMATPSSPEGVRAYQDDDPPAPGDEADLLAELLAAEAEFERGDYIELTVEQLEHCAATGEWPWPDDELRS